MAETFPPVRVLFADEFQRRLRTLAKRYRQIRADVKPVIDQLENGNFVGDRIPGTGYTVLKVRIKNSDIQKGKSAGYRLIYQVVSPSQVLLLTLYSKSDQADISTEETREVVSSFQAQNPGEPAE
ncbi:type II toxin-antitoxin system RelE/ParE family toxin [Thermoleptolyngbya sp.]